MALQRFTSRGRGARRRPCLPTGSGRGRGLAPWPQVSVFVADGELNIAPTATAVLSAQVSYDAADDEWVVLTPDAVGGAGCSGSFREGSPAAKMVKIWTSTSPAEAGRSHSRMLIRSRLRLDDFAESGLRDGRRRRWRRHHYDRRPRQVRNSTASRPSPANDQITTGSGTDVLDGGDGPDLMTGGGGDDRFESPGHGGAASRVARRRRHL